MNGGTEMDVREKKSSEKRLIDYYYLAEKIECPGEPLVYWYDIEAAPTVDAAEVVHGRWLHTEEPLGWKDVDCMECSACHDSWIIEEDYCFDDMPLWNYCPSCGAKMDEDRKSVV